MTRRPPALALRLVGAGVAGLVALTVSGCSAVNQVTTNTPYALSDGVRTTLGPIVADNLLVVSSGKGEPGVVSGALTNNSTDPVQVTLTAAGQKTGSTLRVDAGGTVYLGTGTDVGEHVPVASVDAAPGQVVALTLAAPSAGTTTVQVPVLDGTLPQYATLVPTPTPTPTR